MNIRKGTLYLESATSDRPWDSLTLEKESSNKLRQIQELSLLKILHPSLEPGIPNRPTVHRLRPSICWIFPDRNRVTVHRSRVRAKIVDRNIVQHRLSKKRNNSFQRKLWRINSRWKSSSTQINSQGFSVLSGSFSVAQNDSFNLSSLDPSWKSFCQWPIRNLTHRVLLWAHVGSLSISWRLLYRIFISIKMNQWFTAGFAPYSQVWAPSDSRSGTLCKS